MNPSTVSTVQSVFDASHRGDIHFGAVVAQLANVGVESYHVDYRAGMSTYVLSDDHVMALNFQRTGIAVAEAFDGNAVAAAIREIQQGRVTYPEFQRLTQKAGCVGYSVWIKGRHVSYHGRRGETHIENFPD